MAYVYRHGCAKKYIPPEYTTICVCVYIYSTNNCNILYRQNIPPYTSRPSTGWPRIFHTFYINHLVKISNWPLRPPVLFSKWATYSSFFPTKWLRYPVLRLEDKAWGPPLRIACIQCFLSYRFWIFPLNLSRWSWIWSLSSHWGRHFRIGCDSIMFLLKNRKYEA